MEQIYLTVLLLVVLFALLGSGLWVAMSLLGVGLVGMAFHPLYAQNGKFYVSMMTDGLPPTSRIREYTLDAAGTPGSPRDLLVYAQPKRELRRCDRFFGSTVPPN